MPIYFAKSLFWQNKSAICQIKTPSQNGIEKGGFFTPSVLFRFSQNLLCLLRKEDKSNRQGGLQILFREQCHCPDRLRQGCKCNRIPCICVLIVTLLLTSESWKSCLYCDFFLWFSWYYKKKSYLCKLKNRRFCMDTCRNGAWKRLFFMGCVSLEIWSFWNHLAVILRTLVFHWS